MNAQTTANMAWSAVRTILAFGAGILVREGLIDLSTAAELTGAIMVLAPLAWGMWTQHRAEIEAKKRETVAVQAGVAAAQANAVVRPPETITPVEAQNIIAIHAP